MYEHKMLYLRTLILHKADREVIVHETVYPRNIPANIMVILRLYYGFSVYLKLHVHVYCIIGPCPVWSIPISFNSLLVMCQCAVLCWASSLYCMFL